MKIENSKLKIPLVVVFTLFFFVFFPSHVKATVANPVSYEITVSTSIGEPKLTLFGYTSPHALVQLEGRQVAEEVIAGENGFFFFDRIFLPKPASPSQGGPNPQYPELCLNSIDTQSRISFPVCLPPLPTGPFNINIGPVLLAPTFSLEKVKAEGLTIPNSEVTVFLANDSETPRMVARQRPRLLRGGIAHAYSLPQYKIKSDSQGRFEFSLPTIKPNNWRLFTAAKFQGSPTPKSNTLNFKILNWWQWLLLMITNLLGAFLRLVRPYLWLIIILSEIIIAIGLLVKRFELGLRKNKT